MFARALLAFSLLQALLIYLPMPLWPLWKLHFAALEACLLGVVTGAVALWLGRGRVVRVTAALCIVAASVPAIAVIPAYVRERQSFSMRAWITGGSDPAIDVQRDVALAPGLLVDVYRARGAGPRPFAMVVHGGSWRGGDKGDAAHVSRALARDGITVFDVRYRLAPSHRSPAAVQDIKCLLGRLAMRAREFSVDPARGALLGRSAGAQIALVSAYSDDSIAPSCAIDSPPPPLRAVVSIYGPTDLAWAHGHPYWSDVVNGVDALEQYLGGPPERVPDAYAQATPQRWIPRASQLPATLVIHGTGERCVRPENAERLAAALSQHGHRVRTLLIPFAEHGFDVRPGGFGEQLSRGVLREFLAANLR